LVHSGWAATFGTSKRGLAGGHHAQFPPYAVPNAIAHPSRGIVYEHHIYLPTTIVVHM